MLSRKFLIIISVLLLLSLTLSLFYTLTFQQKAYKTQLLNAGETIMLAYGESTSIQLGDDDNTEFITRMYPYILTYNMQIGRLAYLVNDGSTPKISYSRIVKQDEGYIIKNREVYEKIGDKLFKLGNEKYVSKQEVKNLLYESYQILKDKDLLYK